MELSSAASPMGSATRAIEKGFAPWLRVWAILAGYLILAKVVFTYVFPVTFEKGSGQANVFSWPFVIVFALLLLVGMWLQQRTGFPAPLDSRISSRLRFALPVAVGVGFSLLSIALDLIYGGTKIAAASTGNATFNIAFPGSLFAYTGGAIIVETLYRFFTLPLLLFVISNLILRGRYQTQVFWVLAIVLAAWEPLTQAQATLGLGAGTIAYTQVIAIYAYNLTQNAFFRRYGILAPLMLRFADYLVWHVTYGNFICQC